MSLEQIVEIAKHTVWQAKFTESHFGVSYRQLHHHLTKEKKKNHKGYSEWKQTKNTDCTTKQFSQSLILI